MVFARWVRPGEGEAIRDRSRGKHRKPLFAKVQVRTLELFMPRTREYDEAKLVAGAMDVFWSTGYRGTSIEGLVAGTGVNRASLYTAYTDKRALFVASIERYLDDIVQENVGRLRSVEPADEAVRKFFVQLVEAPLAGLQRGCLLTNAAAELGMSDKRVAALIRHAFASVEDALCARLAEAKKAGRLASHLEPRRCARHLITLLQGLRVMARVGVDRAALRDAADAALSGIGPAMTVETGRTAVRRHVRPQAPKQRAH